MSRSLLALIEFLAWGLIVGNALVASFHLSNHGLVWWAGFFVGAGCGALLLARVLICTGRVTP